VGSASSAASLPHPPSPAGAPRSCREAPIESDDEVLNYARQKGSTVYHATGTCKMGGGRIAVVDDKLRVHGIEGLRVVDASVMPTVISTNINAPMIMMPSAAPI
jgi:choline dehydrogenase